MRVQIQIPKLSAVSFVGEAPENKQNKKRVDKKNIQFNLSQGKNINNKKKNKNKAIHNPM